MLRRARIRTSLFEVVSTVAATTANDREVVATTLRILRDGRAVMHARRGVPGTRSDGSRF